MNNSIKNIIEDGLERATRTIEDGLNRTPEGLSGYELEAIKEELELCLELIKK